MMDGGGKYTPVNAEDEKEGWEEEASQGSSNESLGGRPSRALSCGDRVRWPLTASVVVVLVLLAIGLIFSDVKKHEGPDRHGMGEIPKGLVTHTLPEFLQQAPAVGAQDGRLGGAPASAPGPPRGPVEISLPDSLQSYQEVVAEEDGMENSPDAPPNAAETGIEDPPPHSTPPLGMDVMDVSGMGIDEIEAEEHNGSGAEEGDDEAGWMEEHDEPSRSTISGSLQSSPCTRIYVYDLDRGKFRTGPKNAEKLELGDVVMKRIGSWDCITTDPGTADLFVVPAFAGGSTTTELTCIGGVSHLIEKLQKVKDSATGVSYLDRWHAADHILVAGHGRGWRSDVCNRMWTHPKFRLAAKLSVDTPHIPWYGSNQEDMPSHERAVAIPPPTASTKLGLADVPLSAVDKWLQDERSEALTPGVVTVAIYIPDSIPKPFRSVKADLDRDCSREQFRCYFVGRHAPIQAMSKATFCPMIPGKSPTDMPLLNAIFAGCIPVVFERDHLTLWPNHWDGRGALLVQKSSSAMDEMFRMSEEQASTMVAELAAVAPSLVLGPTPRQNDALVLAIRGVFEETQRLKAEGSRLTRLARGDTSHASFVFIGPQDVGRRWGNGGTRDQGQGPSFQQYRAACQARGGELASIHSDAEQKMACDACAKGIGQERQTCYIGAKGSNKDGFEWVNQHAKWNYTHRFAGFNTRFGSKLLSISDQERYGDEADCLWQVQPVATVSLKDVQGAICRFDHVNALMRLSIKASAVTSSANRSNDRRAGAARQVILGRANGACQNSEEGFAWIVRPVGTQRALEPPDSSACIHWVQTKNCDGNGDVEEGKERSCDYAIPQTLSGFCLCKGGIRHPFSCGHKDLTCSSVCGKSDQATASIDLSLARDLSSASSVEIDFYKDHLCQSKVHTEQVKSFPWRFRPRITTGLPSAVESLWVELSLSEDDEGGHVSDDESQSAEVEGRPGCMAARLDFLGDGYCDGGLYNTPECDFDGGDCCEETCVSRDYQCGKVPYECLASKPERCINLQPANSLSAKHVRLNRCFHYLPFAPLKLHVATECGRDNNDPVLFSEPLAEALASGAYGNCPPSNPKNFGRGAGGVQCVLSPRHKELSWAWIEAERCWSRVVQGTQNPLEKSCSSGPARSVVRKWKICESEGGARNGVKATPKSAELHPGVIQFIQENLAPFKAAGGVSWEMTSRAMNSVKTQVMCIVGGVTYFKCIPGVSSCEWPDYSHEQLMFWLMLDRYRIQVKDVCIVVNFHNHPRVRTPEDLNRVKKESAEGSGDGGRPGVGCVLDRYHDSDRHNLTFWDQEIGNMITTLTPVFGFTGAPSLGYTDIMWLNPNVYQMYATQFKKTAVAGSYKRGQGAGATCVWRGSSTGGNRHKKWREIAPRAELVKKARSIPELDAKLTKTVFVGVDQYFSKNGMEGGNIPEKVQFQKFPCILDICGHAWSQRFKRLLQSHSVVLKVNSPYTDHFERALRPNEHYVPVCSDLSNLKEQVQWVKDNPAEAQSIADRATKLMNQYGTMEALMVYAERLLNDFADLQLYDPAEIDFSTWHTLRVPITREGRPMPDGDP